MSDLPTITRLITWLPVGGIERRLVSVLPRLRDRGWPVRLVLLRERGALAQQLIDAGIPVRLIPLRSRLDPRGLMKLRSEFIKTGTRLIHAHMYRSSVPATIAGHFARVPVILSQVHNVDTWESSRQAWMDRMLSRWRTGTICVSGAVRDDVCRTLRLTPDRVPLYNGSDTEVFRPDAESGAAVRRELSIGDRRTVVLVPARLHANKNPILVLKAFLEAVDRCGADALLVYAGSGGMEQELRDAIREAGTGGKVLLLGRRDDMPALYNAADVVLLSSIKEGFSNAVVEALSCGKPVIAADVGGNKEAIDSEATGWIHDAGDRDALVRQLAEALASPAALQARADACRARGLVFSLDQLVEETDALYRRALAAAGTL